MAIITISRGSYSRGKEIAEKVAVRLGYECVAREALLEASEHFDIPEAKLIRAVHDAPSILDRFAHGKEKYVAYIQAALTRYVQKDGVVYHGLAGHFLLQGISHVLKVRITAAIDDRVQVVMERDNVDEKEALRILHQDDEQRKSWSHYLYGIDTTDPSLYDLMLCIEKISVDGAVDIICSAVGAQSFRTTAQSQKTLDDLVLACEVRSHLIVMKPDVEVEADDGVVLIRMAVPMPRQDAVTREITNVAQSLPGVKEVHVEMSAASLYDSED